MGCRNPHRLLILLALLIALMVSCSPASPSPTPVPPTETAAPTPVPPTVTTAPTTNPSPTIPSPGGRAPAIKNYSLVTGSVLQVSPVAEDSTLDRLVMEITSTAHVENYPSFTDDKVGQEMEILLDSTLAETAAAGNNVQIKVTYRGDERGGGFYGTELTILP